MNKKLEAYYYTNRAVVQTDIQQTITKYSLTSNTHERDINCNTMIQSANTSAE